MSRKTKAKYPKQRKPFIVLICEGRNKTEKIYFTNFISRDNKYNLKILSCESTDIKSMIAKAKQTIIDYQLSNTIGDKLFIVSDLDISKRKQDIINEEKTKKGPKDCKIEFIISNPCFETWLLYYYTANPRVVNTSQKVKEELKKIVPLYSENYDIISHCHLENKHTIAINNSEKKNLIYNDGLELIEKNPYTEVQDLVILLLEKNNC